MRKLAIIGASYFQMPLIEKAKEMGLETHVFSWGIRDVGQKEADYFYRTSIVEKQKILNKCLELGIDGICSIASDLAVPTVNYVASNMGLYGNSIESSNKSTNKHLMRLAFEERGDPSPKSIKVNINTNLERLKLCYPVIIKPTDRSGSRGVCKLDNEEGIVQAVERAVSESFEKYALIEEYVEGKEYSVECLSFKGVHHFLALTEKFTTGQPYYIEKAHIEPANIDEKTTGRILRIVFRALDTLEIKNGASHSEIKINDGGEIKIIEIGARMGGDCIGSDLVRYSTGIDYTQAVIEVALGIEPKLERRSEPIPVKSVFILNENDNAEFKRLKESKSERLLKVVSYFPENINNVTDSSNRAGCYILRQ